MEAAHVVQLGIHRRQASSVVFECVPGKFPVGWSIGHAALVFP